MTDRLASLRQVRDGLLADGVTQRGVDGRERALVPVAIGRAEGDALVDWITREQAANTLEVGLGFAVATLFICDGLLAQRGNVHHVAIDPFEYGDLFGGSGVAHLEDAGVRDLVELHEEPSEFVLPRLLADRRRFDFAFVDGSHRFEAVLLDLIFAGRLVREHGVVFADDAQIPSVRKAVDFCRTNLGWRVEDDGTEGEAHHWVVMRTGTTAVFARPYTDFVDF